MATRSDVGSQRTAKANALPFACISCKEGRLSDEGDRLTCLTCHATYPVVDGVPMLVPPDGDRYLSAEVGDRAVSLRQAQRVYDLAYHHDDLMGTDLDRAYDRTTKTALLTFAGSLSGRRLLDIGTGVGNLWNYAPTDVEGYAVDISAVGVSRSIRRHPRLTASVSVAEHLPYPDKFFDGVVAADTLEHTFCPERSQAEIRRVLKPGGVFAASYPVRDSLRKWGWNQLVHRRLHPAFFARLGMVPMKQRAALFRSLAFQPIDRDRDLDERLTATKDAGMSVAAVSEWPQSPQAPIVYLVHAVRDPEQTDYE